MELKNEKRLSIELKTEGEKDLIRRLKSLAYLNGTTLRFTILQSIKKELDKNEGRL